MHPDRIRAIRAMYADFSRLMAAGMPDDPAVLIKTMELTGMLAESVPYLLDEIEQLQAERTEGGRPRIRTWAKMDRMGGNA